MRIVRKKYKVRNLKTNGIKIIGHNRIKWYKVRTNFKVEPLWNESKSVQAMHKLFNTVPEITGRIVSINW